MAIINGFDSELLAKIAAGYEVMDGSRLGLKQKEGIPNNVRIEATAALQLAMGESMSSDAHNSSIGQKAWNFMKNPMKGMEGPLFFNLNNSVEPRYPEYRQKMRDMIDAINSVQKEKILAEQKMQETSAAEKVNEIPPENRTDETITKTEATNDSDLQSIETLENMTGINRETLENILGIDLNKYNLKYENNQLTIENAPQEVITGVYNRLRSFNFPLTANIDENGAIIGLRLLSPGESPIELNNDSVKDEVQPTVDPTINTEYESFMNAGIEQTTKNNNTTESNAPKNEAPTKYEIAVTNKDNTKNQTNENSDEKNTDDVDKLVLSRMDERFKTAEGLQRLTDTVRELNKLFTIDGNLLIAKEGITPEDIDFANTSLEYFYPTTLVMNDAGQLIGLAPLSGYEPLAEIVYSTMRQASKAEDFADKTAEKKAAQDALIQVESIDYADYVNDYIYTNPSNTSDENEVLYNAIKFTALQAVKPAAERVKYSEIVTERGDESVYTTRDVIEREINSLNVTERTAYANALNDVREAVLDALPPKTLVEFQDNLDKQLADENLSVEEREELTSKLNSVHARMDEMVNDVADGKAIFNDLQLAEHYEGLTSVIQARSADNPKAQNASNILEAAIADYDERYDLDGLTNEDAELLMDRAIQTDRALSRMGMTQILGRKLKNAVSSNKLSTEREFTISEENDKLLRGIVYTDENGTVVPQMDENGKVHEDSLIFQIEDMAIAYAYNKAVLGREKITRESVQADVNDFIYSTAVNMVMSDMNAKGTPISGEEAEKRVQAISPENPYQISLSAGTDQIVTQTQQMVGMIDRVGQKIGRTAPVLNNMHNQLSHLDTQMANSRFKTEYLKSNRLVNTVKKIGTMATISAAYGLAFSVGGAALGAGLIAGMTTMRTLAGFTQYKRQMRKEGVETKNFMQYLWSEKAQIAASAASIVAAAGGLAWLSYSVAGLNLANNYRHNLNRDKKAGQSRTIKDNIMGGVETALPMGVSLAMNVAMGGIFADRGDPNASFVDNISNTFSDAFSGLKDVFGLGDATAGTTPEIPATDNANIDTAATNTVKETDLPPVNAHTVTPPTAAGTVVDAVANAADSVNDTPQTIDTIQDGATGIQVPHPDLENQTPPPDATFIQSSADFAAESVTNEAPQAAVDNVNTPTTVQDNVVATSDTAAVRNEVNGTTTFQDEPIAMPVDMSPTAPADAASSTGTSDATTDTADTTVPSDTQNIHEAQAFNHTYDQAAHQHAEARIHGQGINYKLDYNETQLNTALDQIRTIGEDYPQMNGVGGQSNAEILMYKLNQIDQLVAHNTDIVTPEGRVEAQAFYGHKMPDGSWYGPHDLRADLLAGKEVDPQIAAEIFAKIEPHVDATGHHIGDIHNIKEANTFSYRQTGIGGFTEDAIQPPTPGSDGVYGHLNENGMPPVTDVNNQTIPVATEQNETLGTPVGVANANEQQNTVVEPFTKVSDAQETFITKIVGTEQTMPQTPSDTVQEAGNLKEVPVVGAEQSGPQTPSDTVQEAGNLKEVPVVGAEQSGPQTPSDTVQEAGNPKGVPFVPYIPYDKPYMSKIRRTLNDRIGAWMEPIKRALGIKEDIKPEQSEKTTAQVPLMLQNTGIQNDANTIKGADKTTGNAASMPQGPRLKRLVVTESDLPKDPYFNLSPISKNIERDVNGAWVADFRKGALKINRTAKTTNADLITGKLPNTPIKGEIEPTVIPMDMKQKTTDTKQLDNREGLPEPQKGLPEPQAIRLGTEQVSDKVIPMPTQQQQAAFKRQMFDGNVPKHIREILEQRAQKSEKPQMLLEDKEGKTQLTSEQAKALLDKYHDVTTAVESMKQTSTTQNTATDNVDLKVQSRQKQPQTQTGNNGKTLAGNATVWKHLAQKKHKQP